MPAFEVILVRIFLMRENADQNNSEYGHFSRRVKFYFARPRKIMTNFTFIYFLDFREFICSLSLTTRGKIEDKLRFAFKIYDVNNDNKISFSEMKCIIRCCQGMRNNYDNRLSDENLKKFFDESDLNDDGLLSYNEFKSCSMKNPLFLQVLNENLS